MTDPNNTAPQTQETSVGRWLIETALLVLLAFVIAQGVKTFIIQPFVIPTESMVPTIQIGDRVFAEKISYRFKEPERGDIIVFDDPDDQHPQLIKRIIGLPGETVEIKNSKVYIDGVELPEPYTHGAPTEQNGPVLTPITVPEGYVWVMGDNRPNSGDSRFFGPQKIEVIRGRAFFTYWPLSAMGPLE